MAAATSATVTVDPPAVKKRGRPRKVVDESAAQPEKPAARKASTKASPKAKAAPKAKTIDAMKEKKKTLTRVSDYKAKKETPTPTPTPTPTQKRSAQQATPVTPTSSKILDEVKAAGAFRKPAATPPPAEPEQPFIPPVPGPAPVAPIMPAATSPVESADTAPSTSSTPPPPPEDLEQPFIPPIPGPAPVAPIQQPIDNTPPKPVIPPTLSAADERANIIPPKPRATIISLPRNPLTAPSPTTEPSRPRVSFVDPAPRAPRTQRYPTRIIQPMPNAKLPPKYKKAARQVTSIMVGIPFIIVVGYELYGRWKNEISIKFEERASRDQPGQLSG
ncbi:hypothetical protein ST47_g9027 [Ascochyta rabiei]|uniref:Uncharacterized protein n=2 Tax=Didymella rabiei TaxID=5454 RepID=A0A162Y6W4_DIDRA|nr:hypothetical protein ST47_g9027 [Ascochyta rabiei]